LNPGRMLGKAAGVSPGAHKSDSAPETAPLSRSGRKLADAIMAAAKFKPTADGSRLVRQYEVYGIEVTEWISAESFAGIRS
jgi:hypothetical protein